MGLLLGFVVVCSRCAELLVNVAAAWSL
ncbi:hypothetical protein OIU74_004176, partial [Salix koriyanagi]